MTGLVICRPYREAGDRPLALGPAPRSDCEILSPPCRAEGCRRSAAQHGSRESRLLGLLRGPHPAGLAPVTLRRLLAPSTASGQDVVVGVGGPSFLRRRECSRLEACAAGLVLRVQIWDLNENNGRP